ncbi:MAG: voltage-gated potassium channel [Deferribacteres bacterium]|nr:voltage-gated potassium channel [Deferribacteres bacterium]
MNLIKKLILSIVVILFILIAGTVGYEYIEGASFLNAFYMTVITITTVGFNEVFSLSNTGKYFTVFLILTGTGTIAFAFTQVLEIIIAGEVKKILVRRKMDKKIKNLKEHYIVCGYGRIGKIICEQLLSKKIPFIVIDKDESNIAHFNEKEILYIIGDATKESVLLDANILEAKGLVAVVNSDAENVYIVLTAKGFSKNLYVIARASGDESATKMFWAGAESANSKLVGKKIIESNIRKIGITVVGIKKKSGEFIYNPGPETIFEASDTVIALGQTNDIEQLEKLS